MWNRKLVIIAGLVALITIALGLVAAAPPDAGPPADLGQALAAQKAHTNALLGNLDVVGTAVGYTDDGRPAVLILTRRTGVGRLPASLDGVAVVVHVTGELSALDIDPNGKGGVANAASTKIDPKKWFTRPVPIGVSTGNANECSAGTIGARVKDTSGNVYALSNNHVYANENKLPAGTKVLQPGLYDTGCVFDLKNVIGTLAAFQPIVFTTSASNTIDAAIAASTTVLLGKATPSNGYGLPKSATVSAFVGQSVQKYGRTTSLTKGTVTGINAIVNVGYGSGTARFVDQIFVQSRTAFLKAGDSGSLLVTNPGRNPVGLLFAGNSSGTFAVANRIDLVLSGLGVAVDGE